MSYKKLEEELSSLEPSDLAIERMERRLLNELSAHSFATGDVTSHSLAREWVGLLSVEPIVNSVYIAAAAVFIVLGLPWSLIVALAGWLWMA